MGFCIAFGPVFVKIVCSNLVSICTLHVSVGWRQLQSLKQLYNMSDSEIMSSLACTSNLMAYMHGKIHTPKKMVGEFA